MEKKKKMNQLPERNIKVKRDFGKEEQSKQKKQNKEEVKRLRKQLRELDKRRRARSKLPTSVQQTIPYLADYDNGIFEIEKMKEGSRYSISLAFEDMNYQSQKPDEAKTIFTQYINLFNAIPSDVDLELTLVNLNEDKDKIIRKIAIPYMEDNYIELREEMNQILEQNISKGNNYLHKERYLTISLLSANVIDAAKRFNRIQTEITNTMKRMGTVSRRLSTLERLYFLHDFYNQNETGSLEKLGIDYKDVIENNINLKDYVCPEGFEFRTNYMKIGNTYAKYLVIREYGRIMSDRFLGELFDMPFNELISLTIHPIPMADGMKLVNKQILGMEANKQEGQKAAIKSGYTPDMINHNLKDALDDALELREAITNQNQKLFEVCFNIVICGNTKEELEKNIDAVKTLSSKYLSPILIPNYVQEQGLKQTLPMGHVDKIDSRRTLTSESVAIFIPFLSHDLMQKGGFYYGINPLSNKMIIFNRLTLNNANGFILGASGAGKSFTGKREIANILFSTADEVIVIDPDGEYVPFSKELGGEHIVISPTSSTHINPMDMDRDYGIEDKSNPLISKSDFLISVVETAISNNAAEFGISPIQRALIDKCVGIVYEDYMRNGYKKEDTPTMRDLQRVFRQQENVAAQEIADAFQLFTDGSLSVFSNPTNVDIKKRFTVFDISELGKNLNAMGSLIMLDAVWNHVIRNRKRGVRTWLYVDEFTVLLRKESSKIFFLDTFKRIRKMGGACTGITQNITSLFRDEDAMEMLANAEFIQLLNQAATDRIPLAEILSMSETELEYVSDVPKGCGLIKAGRHIVPFVDEFPKNTQLYKCMTTDPEERKKIDRLA